MRAHEFHLRTKEDTTVADRSWRTEQADPNTAEITVGTAADGDWRFTIAPVDSTDPTPDSIVFTRASAETTPQIAAAWAALFNEARSDADGPTTFAKYIKGAAATATSVIVTTERTSPTYGVVLASPGGTASISPDDSHWPIARYMPTTWDGNRPTRSVLVRTVAVNSSGVPIAIDTAATFSFRVLDGTEMDDGSIVAGFRAAETSVEIGESRRVQYSGGLFGVELSAIATPPTGIAALHVFVCPSDS